MWKHQFASGVCYLVLSWVAIAQPIGVATVPAEMLKTTVLIEQMKVSTNDHYIGVPGAVALLIEREGKLLRADTSNIFMKVPVGETKYTPIGSGCILSHSNLLFLVTASHVIPTDEDVHFRIVKSNRAEVHHLSAIAIKRDAGMGWVRSTNADLAICPIPIEADADHKAVDTTGLVATFDDVKIGDDLIVVGYPSSVLDVTDPNTHAIRSGMVSSKQSNNTLIIESFVFPGNSGGPVFWKPSMGLKLTPPLTGTEIPARPPALVGIVISYLSYSEPAISPTTQRLRVMFEENSGLAQVVSWTRIAELLQDQRITDFIAKTRKRFGLDPTK